jgi:hypothetical protein
LHDLLEVELIFPEFFVDFVFADFRESEFGDIIEDIVGLLEIISVCIVFQFADLIRILPIQDLKILFERTDILQDIL